MSTRTLTLSLAVFLSLAAGLFSAAHAGAPDLGLIEASQLKESASRWVILDGRSKGDWEAGHIPGSYSFCWENYTRTDESGVEYRIFPQKELAAAFGALGIDENTPVVVYGDADKSWGGEAWDAWVLSWLGHKGPIRLLNGGVQAWRNQGYGLVKTPAGNAQRKDYKVNTRPEIQISTEELDKKKESFSIVDVRSVFERMKGDIPGSVRISWEDFRSGKERRPLGPEETKRLLKKHGVDTSRPVVYFCYAGIRSSYTWLVHQLAGLPTARNYEGGWAAWQKRPSR